ncbi:helix-turn-helix domain-containing protein [Qipengyuania sp.]|uniref:helix-turn-helix domain-containing protein n=1 Tax=Qipengyuania sp. TaxID=2004515 RepID=UPI0035C7D66F
MKSGSNDGTRAGGRQNAVARPLRFGTNTGSTPQGMPLALTRRPNTLAQPWISNIGVTDVTLAPGGTIEDCTFNAHPVLRIIYGAHWTARTADGLFEYHPGDAGLPLYFGPNAHAMPLSVHGSFRVVTVNFVPGASSAFDVPPQPETVDRIYRMDPISGSPAPLPGYEPKADVRDWLDAVDNQLCEALAAADPAPPHDLMAAFETASLTDPSLRLDDFARARGVSRRTLERIIRREWGLSPAEALRRARGLDLAALLLGVALEEEEQDLRLRYFDEPHMIREMRHFFAMTPGQLRNGSHPLLRITMEIRQSRRVELLERIAAGQLAPWRDPGAEPGGPDPAAPGGLSRKAS